MIQNNRPINNEHKNYQLKKNLTNIRNNSKDDFNRKNKVSFEPSYSPSLNIEKDLERYTPNTDFDDYPQEFFHEHQNVPDLALICKQCNNHINIEELSYHDKFHELLSFFGFKEAPDNEEKLIERRLVMIKNLIKPLQRLGDEVNKKSPELNNKIMLINENYEILKSFLNHSFEANRVLQSGVKTETRGESRVVSNEKIVAIGTCAVQNSHRKTMEDQNIILDNFGENSNLTYIGTFDGYDGDVSSTKCVEQMHLGILYALENMDNSKVQFVKQKYDYDEINNLEKYDYSMDDQVHSSNHFENLDSSPKKFNLKNFVNDDQNYDGSFTDEEKLLMRIYRNSFKYTYSEMDKLLARGRGEVSRIRWSGCTLCSCIIEKKDNTGWIHLANCGDVEAIVVINNAKSVKKTNRNHKVLTCLHTLNDCLKDRVSLEKKGCNIYETSLGVKKINGLYSITRGLGFHGDIKTKKFLNPKPSIRSYKIEDNYVALIIGTKGLWNAISYEKVADIVLQMMPSRKVPLINERPTSPSVKTILHQYYINRNKEKSREKSILQTVQDNNEVDYVNPVENENEKYESNESINSKFEKNDEGFQNGENLELESRSNELLQKSAKLEFNQELEAEVDIEQNDSGEKENLEVESNKSNKRTSVGIQIKPSDLKVVQVDDYELNKFHRKVMVDRKLAKKLDISELIAETLVSSALKAGSTDNITVNCVLLPACNI